MTRCHLRSNHTYVATWGVFTMTVTKLGLVTVNMFCECAQGAVFIESSAGLD